MGTNPFIIGYQNVLVVPFIECLMTNVSKIRLWHCLAILILIVFFFYLKV